MRKTYENNMAQSLPTLRDNSGFLTLFRRCKEQDKTQKHPDLYLGICFLHSSTIHHRDHNKSRESGRNGSVTALFYSSK